MGKLLEPSDYELVEEITKLAGDGYCPASDLLVPFRRFEGRRLMKALRRAVNRALILERQGPDGRRYVAIASEAGD